MKKLSTHEAITLAVKTGWRAEHELVAFCRSKGVYISGSSATRRLRECRQAGLPVTGRWFKTKRGRQYKYGVCED